MASWKPAPTTDTYDENPIAAISAVITAYNAIKTFLKVSLSTLNSWDARRNFREYVNLNHENFSRVMTENLSTDQLEDAWTHREAVSLQIPFKTFRSIFTPSSRLAREEDDQRIRDLGLRTNDQLAEFDALNVAPPPTDVRSALVMAEDKLYKYANNSDISLDDLISALSDITTQLSATQKAYEEADKAVVAVGPAYKK